MSLRIVFFFLSYLLRSLVIGQVANFTSPNQVCLNQSVLLSNTSTGATSYLWDFCHDGLFNASGANLVADMSITTPGIVSPEGIDVENDNGNWFAFAFGRDNNTLYRIDFGVDLSNPSPVIVSLGNIGGKFLQPTQIELIKDNGNWYGFVTNFGNSHLVKLNFGNSLSAVTPILTASDLGAFGPGSGPRGLDIVKKESGYAGIVSYWDNTVSLLDFAGGIDTPPSFTYTITNANGNIVRPVGVALQNDGNNWHALLSDYSGDKVLFLDFGNNLFSNPVFTILATAPIPTDVAFLKDGLNYFGFVESSSGLIRLDFGSDLSQANAVNVNPPQNFSGSLSGLFGLSFVRTGAEWRALTISQSNNKVHQVIFNDVCSNSPASLISSTAQVPNVLLYTQPGAYFIDLIAFSASGAFDITGRPITVTNNQAPVVDFSTANQCVLNPNVFVASQKDQQVIVNWIWNFGDGNTASLQNPTNQYSNPGTYHVTLDVTAANLCSNRLVREVKIFNRPTASFVPPSGSPLCTNQDLTFSNNSSSDVGSNPTWEWYVNGAIASTTRDLTFRFTNATTQAVKLKAGIPGCFTEAEQTVSSLLVGPNTNFTVSGKCQAETLQFTNLTSGTVSGYTWNFGDGQTSNQTSPAHSYTAIGDYTISLVADSPNGCINPMTKKVTIYSKPQPDFSIGLPPFSCAGSPSQFTDQTPAPTDSNIAAWQWAFGDPASGTSTTRNPTYTYSTAGTYNVSLAATTNFGCTGSIQKAVTISASPQAAFTNSVACVSQPTQFTDASSGSIRSRLWTIQGNSFTTPNVQFAFVNSGSYPVLLTVTGTNNCTGQAVKNIVVPVLPTLDFSVQAACNTNPTLFSEITTGADAPLSQTWNFASLGTGTGATTQFTFSTPGNYAVQLRSTRQSGCVYSITKNVSVTQGPVADFTPSVDVGGPPLSVNFVNTSTGASSYLWRFGNSANTTSTVVSPNFTFNELGVYAVKLTASNTAGCSFTTSKPITVLVPNINVMLSDFRATPDGSGILQPTVSIVNSGNLPVSNPDLLIDVASAGLVRKKLNARILPNQTMSVPVDLQIVARSAGYICAELVVPNNTADFDKRRCLPLGSDEILFAPYPNPAADILNFDWVSTQAKPVSVMVFNPGGSEVFRQQFESIAAGLNRLQIKTTELPNGLYYILYSDGTTTKSFSFAVAKN